jgi:hypothetical protein
MNVRMLGTVSVVAGFGLLNLLGCGDADTEDGRSASEVKRGASDAGSGTDASDRDQDKAICAPRADVFCRCEDRSEGTKQCNAEGTGFSACVCDGAKLCTPEANVFCRCDDRTEGTKECNATGTGFGPCLCANAESLCTPNAHVFCRCPDGSEGTKACNADGSDFGSCTCG